VQTILGIGPVPGAVLVAEIGDVTRFGSADKHLLDRDVPAAPRV